MRTKSSRKRLLLFGALLTTLAAGCRMVQTAVDAPGNALRAVTPGLGGRPPVNPVEVQQTLLRFADEFATLVTIGVDQLQRGTNALGQAETLQWKIALSSEICTIASGPNAVAALLDMTIFVTITRMAMEEYWLPTVFGDSGKSMLDGCRTAEAEIWRLAGKMLTPAEQTELHEAITSWYQKSPNPESILVARGVTYAPRVAQASAAGPKPSSVFDLLRVDPLSSLDPAVRELAQTRLFAERALYVSQKMPMLLRWQAELLIVNAVELPTVQQLVTNTTQLASSMDRFADVAEQFPQQLSTEREAIMAALQSQTEQLAPLVTEIREALLAGSQMSTSLTTTLTTFDSLMQRFGVGETNAVTSSDTNATPFRIQDYTDAAAQIEKSTRELTDLLLTLDRMIGSNVVAQLATQVGPVVEQAETGAKAVVDYAFWRGIFLVLILLTAALVYRLLVTRLTAPHAQH